ncbi:RDD family protein [Salinicoccus jeotgali]|uniref:RDD family protein n=1 Tax=Salinicoccus jeotgali TaxID=381634 RepID=A0ABP7F4M8_9STAP
MSNPAGFWVRLGARVLDALLVGMVVGTILFVFQVDTSSASAQTGESIAGLAYFILLPVYFYGYTIAKRVLNIRVVKVDGSKAGLLPMIIREVLGFFIYSVTFGLAAIASAIMVSVRKDKRSIHDLLAGTYVTFDEPEAFKQMS